MLYLDGAAPSSSASWQSPPHIILEGDRTLTVLFENKMVAIKLDAPAAPTTESTGASSTKP
jgi:hypothetical protein